MRFSVLMSVYKKDNPLWVQTAIKSILNQSAKPDEVVLVIDGPIPEALNQTVSEYETNPLFQVVRLSENVGLGNALAEGLKHCTYELIARMDSDDIAVADRFEKQLTYMEQHPETDLIGGNIAEFTDHKENITGYRKVPSAHEEIQTYLQTRCPFNHMTVMAKKASLLAAGGYLDWFWNEDYYLWIRMHLANMHFANLPEILVYVRVGADMYKRRGGLRYFKSEAKLQRYMHKNGVIGFGTYCTNLAKRLILQVLLPNSIRGFLFRKLARSQENE